MHDAVVHDLREMLRRAEVRHPPPTAVSFDSATRQSTPESGHRAGSDGHKRRKGSTIHLAVDTLEHLLAVLAAAVQEAIGQTVELAFVNQSYTGGQPPADAASQGIQLEVVKLPEANTALCSCRSAGWWSARLPGPAASAAWPTTTNACRTWSLACLSWLFPASCSIDALLLSSKVHNRL